MPSIPKDFCPVVEGYSIGAPGGVLRTEVAGGAPRYGLDYDRGVQQYKVTLVLDALRFSVWTAFFHHVIKKGALSFDMPLDSGFGLQPHTVNIVPGTYSAARTGGVLTVVSMVVEAESAAYGLSASDALALLELYAAYGQRVNAVLDRIAIFSNKDTNVLGYP